MFDMIIEGGTVIDGTGGAPRTADIGIAHGKITEIGRLSGLARHKINADGLLVTPGFIDIHTHYDGQATWDDALYPSFDNGVTTAIVGNCGVGFAPAHPEQRETLVDLMDGVEEIPGSALAVGLKWDWETFPDYLVALERSPHSFNIGALATHGPLRVYTMGNKVIDRTPATSDEIARMCDLLDQALRAGAWGLSSSRTSVHTSRSGGMTPDFDADLAELLELARVVGRHRGIFEFAPLGIVGEDLPGLKRDMAFFERIAEETAATVHLLISQTLTYPEFWREQLKMLDRARDAGHRMYGQVNGRGIGVMLGLLNTNPFQTRATYRSITANLPRDRWLAEFAKPEVRSRILAESDDWPPRISLVGQMLGASYAYADASDYEPSPERKVSAIAQREGKTLEEAGYDWMAGGGFLFAPMLNYHDGNLDAAFAMLMHPSCVVAASDAGAHSLTVCDGALPTFMLAHWARDRQQGPRLPIEAVVKMLTSQPARSVGMTDRGVIGLGMAADLNLVDFDRLSVSAPRVVADLPAGAARLLQGSTGFSATLVGGEVTRQDNADTGVRPGKVLRHSYVN